MLPKSIRGNQTALLKACFAKQGEYRRGGEPNTIWSTRHLIENHLRPFLAGKELLVQRQKADGS